MGTKDDLLTTFPAFFRVDGRKVAIFGGGDEAFAKARLMAKTSAVIAAYAENAEDDYRAFLAEHGYRLGAEWADTTRGQELLEPKWSRMQ